MRPFNYQALDYSIHDYTISKALFLVQIAWMEKACSINLSNRGILRFSLPAIGITVVGIVSHDNSPYQVIARSSSTMEDFRTLPMGRLPAIMVSTRVTAKVARRITAGLNREMNR